MSLTTDQIDKAKAVKTKLDAVEAVHQSRQVIALHHALSELLDTFQADLGSSDYQAMGGGVPKTSAE